MKFERVGTLAVLSLIILVACFNPKYFDNVEIAAKALIIEDVYDF